jgi:hypothetical protein
MAPARCGSCKIPTLGVQGVIAKPFDPLALAKQISETLQWTNES